MPDSDALGVILAAGERLRRIPEGRWRRPPEAPLGARDPSVVSLGQGEPLEAQVRTACAELMRADARARGVPAFPPDVSVFSLPDVLVALAKAVAVREPRAEVLYSVAQVAARW